MNGSVAASRIADASPPSPPRSIAGLPCHRCQRLRQSESSGVERLAHDCALDPAARQRGYGAQIVEAEYTAGGDHGGVGALADRAQQVEIGSGQRTVLGDIGHDEPRTPFAVKAFQYFPQVAAVGLPAATTQPMIAVDDLDVQPDSDLVAVLGDHRSAPPRILQRRSPEVDPRASGRQCGRQRVVVADTAGQFDLHVKLAHDLGQQLTIGAAAERRVQVDQVNPFGTVALPTQRGVQRCAVLGFATGPALHQAHRPALDHVDGGQQNQPHVYNPSTQLLNTAAPASPLFSGWNWVAASGPSSTAARNGTP